MGTPGRAEKRWGGSAPRAQRWVVEKDIAKLDVVSPRDDRALPVAAEGSVMHGGPAAVRTGDGVFAAVRAADCSTSKRADTTGPQAHDEHRLVVRSLASRAGKITGVALLGHTGALDWRQTADGLVVNLPPQKPCDLAYAFRITPVE